MKTLKDTVRLNVMDAVWDGKKRVAVKIIGSTCDSYIVSDLDQLPYEGRTVPKHYIEPLAHLVVKEGQRVKSFHTFSGRVVAFEKETNRVICVSDKIGKYDDDRTRWAYKLKELHAIKPTLKCGGVYILSGPVARCFNGSVHAVALEHPDRSDLFALYNKKDGRHITTVPREMDEDDWVEFGIKRVELI